LSRRDGSASHEPSGSYALALAGDVRDAGAGPVAWTVYLGVCPTAIGFTTWAYALSRTTAGCDHAGSGPDLSWPALIDAHRDEKITYIQIQAGNTGAASSGSTSHVKDINLVANGVAGLRLPAPNTQSPGRARSGDPT
jgi:hypothetical protein